mmetsp:Transcript_53343/g.94841  ORF Transcript_53343/g.94841 Transcript_53343/m.94841 type:complete len:241 (-) Transcript_53343:372-1094(-)
MLTSQKARRGRARRSVVDCGAGLCGVGHICPGAAAAEEVAGRIIRVEDEHEEFPNLIQEVLGPVSIVVTLHHHQATRSTIYLLDLTSVVRVNEVILVRCSKHCWHQAHWSMRYRTELIKVEIRSLLNAHLDDRKCSICKPIRHSSVGLLLTELACQDSQASEWRVHNHASDRWVSHRMQQCCDCTHGAPPQANFGDCVKLAQTLDHGRKVILLEMTQGNILALRLARAGKVHCAEVRTGS